MRNVSTTIPQGRSGEMIQQEWDNTGPTGSSMRHWKPEYLRWPPLGHAQELRAVGIKQVSRNNHAKVLSQRASSRAVIFMQRRGLLPSGSGLSGPDWVNSPYQDGRAALPPARLNLDRLSGQGALCCAANQESQRPNQAGRIHQRHR